MEKSSQDGKRFFAILRHHSALMRCLRCFEVMERNDEKRREVFFLHKALFLDTLEAFTSVQAVDCDMREKDGKFDNFLD